MVDPEGPVIVGYWHNWDNGVGYRGGNVPSVKWSEVHKDYNVIDVSFMTVFNTVEGRIPMFKLDPATGLTEAQFIQEISDLNALDGADAHMEPIIVDEHAHAAELIRLTASTVLTVWISIWSSLLSRPQTSIVNIFASTFRRSITYVLRCS